MVLQIVRDFFLENDSLHPEDRTRRVLRLPSSPRVHALISSSTALHHSFSLSLSLLHHVSHGNNHGAPTPPPMDSSSTPSAAARPRCSRCRSCKAATPPLTLGAWRSCEAHARATSRRRMLLCPVAASHRHRTASAARRICEVQAQCCERCTAEL